MADHRGTLTALCPVAAGAVVARRERIAIGLRPGQDVVHVGCVATAVDHFPLLAQRGLLGDLVVGAVKLSDIVRDDRALGVLPRAGADAVARVDRTRALGT